MYTHALRYRLLGWFGHAQRNSHSINTVRSLQVEGKRKRGRPRKTWEELLEGDMIDWGQSAEDALDKVHWKCCSSICPLVQLGFIPVQVFLNRYRFF